MVNKILIRTSDRKTLHKDRRSLGMSGENLQEVLLFCLDERIEGTGIVEVELPDGEKGMIEVERTEEGYELPVKSSLLTQTGFVKFQLRILHDNEEIFKSEIIALEVKDSINATATIPEEYPSWVDTLTNLKKDLEKAESERVSNEEKRQSAEETRQENFTKMQKKSEEAVSNIKDLTDKYNENDKQKTEAFNKNFEEKQKSINDNAESKIKAFDNNAEAQTKTFNTNSDDKLAEYNRNHTAKMKEFDDNYDTKTKTFDDNAADKVKEYNTNVEQKETELENLAEEKINEYNQVSAELTAKVEQVQAENEALKVENKLIKEQIPGSSVKGNSIHIEDSGSLDFDWKINGGHRQETREGYNIINTMLLENSNTRGVDRINNKDGSLSIKGTATENVTIPIISSTQAGLEKGTYTFVCYGLPADYYTNIYYVGDVYGENIRSFKTDGTKSINMVLVISAGKTVDFKIYPFLIKGTYTKDTISPYEQYGASPSPDYSSEVETVGSNINLLENKAISQTINGVTFTVNKDGSVIANGTATANTTFKINSDIVPKNISNLILSGCPNKGSKTTYDLKIELYKNSVWVKALYDFGNGTDIGNLSEYTSCSISITIRKDYNANNLIFKPKLEKGSVATPYSLPGMGSVEIDVVNSNLLDFNVAQDSRVTVNEDGTLTINGTGGFVLNIDKLQLKAGITYYQKVELTSGSISGSNINTTFLSFAGDGVWISSVNFSQTNLTKDTEKAAIWINASAILNNAVIKIWANTDKSDFVKHQSQTAIMPIQQEMLEGDYIADIEHHEWGKIILTGNESWNKSSTTEIDRFSYNTSDYPAFAEGLSNCFLVKKGISLEVGILIFNAGVQIVINFSNYGTTTLEEFKAWLKSKYEAGTPVIIYYKLAEPLNLELTDEQKAVRNQKLYTYKNITNISLSDELASIDVEYKKDLETEHNKLQNEIDEIKQLLSTTQTSALLLDNLQKEVESEVK